MLSQFAEGWHAEYPHIAHGELSATPAIVQEAYEVFVHFYPLERWYTNLPYTVVQNSLRVSWRENLERENIFRYSNPPLLEIEIHRFRPSLELGNQKALFLTRKYEHILAKEFLGEIPRESVGTEYLRCPEKPRNEWERRRVFLEDFVAVIPGHWGGYHLISPPKVTEICFNRKLDTAIVDFRQAWEGGEARYVKTHGRWRLLSSKVTWSE